MAHDVFISYEHHDKATADAVCATLEARGIRCWIAPRDVLPGTSWATSIVEAIGASRLMVLVFSSATNNAEQVLREVNLASDTHVPILPFRIEDVGLSPGLRFYVSSQHWLDAMTPPLERHLAVLADAVAALLQGEPPPATVQSPSPAAPEQHPSSSPIATAAGATAPTGPEAPPPAGGFGGGQAAAFSAAGPAFSPPVLPAGPPPGAYYGGALTGAQYSAFGRRLGAWCIDGLIVFIPFVVLSVVAAAGAPGNNVSDPVAVVVVVLCWLIAAAYFLWGWGRGRSLGCRSVGIRMIDAQSGAAPGYSRSIIRYLVFSGMYVTGILLLVGALWPLWDPMRQTLWDKAAGTVVIDA